MFNSKKHIYFTEKSSLKQIILGLKLCPLLGLILLNSLPKIAFCQDSLAAKYNTQIGLNLGTYGIQLEYELPIKNGQDISFKTGLFLLNFQQPLHFNLAENSALNIKPKFTSTGLSLKAEKPLRKWLSIYLESRILLKQQWLLNLSTDEGLDLNGLRLESEDFGQIDASLKWWNIQPGVGLLIGKNKPNKQWTAKASIATFYMGSPKLKLSYEGFLETTTLQDEVSQIEANIKNYSFYPALGLNLTYKLAK